MGFGPMALPRRSASASPPNLTACVGEDFLVGIRKKAAGAAFFWGMGDWD